MEPNNSEYKITTLTTNVFCPHATYPSKPSVVYIAYVEKNGEYYLSYCNGCDNNMNGSNTCRNCCSTINEDFKNGNLKTEYRFG